MKSVCADFFFSVKKHVGGLSCVCVQGAPRS